MEDWFHELPNLRLGAVQLAFLGFRPLNLFENDRLQRKSVHFAWTYGLSETEAFR